MDKRLAIAGLLLIGGMAAFSRSAKASAQQDLIGLFNREISALGSVSSNINISAVRASKRLTGAQAASLIAYLDRRDFGGWFERNGLTGYVRAIWRVESGLNPSAKNMSDPRGGAHGIGQVIIGDAMQDYGVPSADSLYDPIYGGAISMRHIQSTIERLGRGLGRAPKPSEWVQAYNAGVSGYLRGVRVPSYLAAVTARLYV